MPFKKILNELVSGVPGASGAIIADWEGEAVQQCCLYDDFELKLIGAHKGIILSRIKEAYSDLGVGEPLETVISAGEQKFILGPVGPEYMLVMTLGENAIIGQALYRFRKTITLLKKEIC